MDFLTLEIAREAEMYPHLASTLEHRWAAEEGFEATAVDVTARQGGRRTGGIWTRPDITLVSVQHLDFIPTATLSVVAFEVKASSAITVEAVYEALAQSRAVTHAYVLLHVPESSRSPLQDSVDRVAAVAMEQGIGLETFADPRDFDTWFPLVSALRREPDPAALNDFLRTQVSESGQFRVRTALGRA